MQVVWDCGALCCYEGFCCLALGLCGFWVDVWRVGVVSIFRFLLRIGFV